MDRDDLIAFLRANLSITIDADHRYAYMGDGHWYEVVVKLHLGDEELSTASTSLDIVE